MKIISKKDIKNEYKKLKNTGFFSIFISNFVSKVIVFFGGIVVVRILSKSDYGTYAYILNCLSMLYLLHDLGVSSASLQFLTENNSNKNKQLTILFYALKIGTIFSIISSIIIIFSPFFYPYKILYAKKMVPLLFGIPFLTFITNMLPVFLRANMENKKFALYKVGETLINYLVLIPLSLWFGLKGAVFSKYLYLILCFVWGLFLCRKILFANKEKEKIEIDNKAKKSFLKFSISCQLNDTMSTLLLVVDTFLIGLLIADSGVIATYKVASTIPHALAFLPSCTMIYVYPYFIKHRDDYTWLLKYLKKLILYSGLVYLLLTLFLILGSRYIIVILFGKQYTDAILPFIILVIGFFFSSTIKIPCANVTYSMKKMKINLILNFLAIILNFVLNIIFIKLFGFVGVAITTTLISIIISFIFLIYTFKVLKGGKKNND